MANFSFETHIIENFLKKSDARIAGCDEVGRGCLAGPVVACCLTFKTSAPSKLLQQVTDSKKLTKVKRENIGNEIRKYAHFTIMEVDVKTIDSINILEASLLAMKNAVEELQNKIQLDAIIIDGNKSFQSNIPTYTLVGGDNISLNIAGASILAKIYRDNLMEKFSKLDQYQHYAWHSNAGYGTKAHLEGIQNYGITKLHRKTFAPIKNFINTTLT